MDDNTTYKTGQLSEILGVSRDTLRYYEEKGIIRPRQSEKNNYREYDFYDIYTLMVTDFYKKRNLTINDVKKLQTGSEIQELEVLLEEKARELEESILIKEYTLKKIRETKEFCKDVITHLNTLSLRRMPTYKILGEITDFDALDEYHLILENIDSSKEDILSKVMRKLTFDETGYLDFKMYIVEKSDEIKTINNDNAYIKYDKCIYTIVEDGSGKTGEEDPKLKAFSTGKQWAEENGFRLEGVVFINTRLITYCENKEKVFLEVFVPIK